MLLLLPLPSPLPLLHHEIELLKPSGMGINYNETGHLLSWDEKQLNRNDPPCGSIIVPNCEGGAPERFMILISKIEAKIGTDQCKSERRFFGLEVMAIIKASKTEGVNQRA